MIWLKASILMIDRVQNWKVCSGNYPLLYLLNFNWGDIEYYDSEVQLGHFIVERIHMTVIQKRIWWIGIILFLDNSSIDNKTYCSIVIFA